MLQELVFSFLFPFHLWGTIIIIPVILKFQICILIKIKKGHSIFIQDPIQLGNNLGHLRVSTIIKLCIIDRVISYKSMQWLDDESPLDLYNVLLI